MLETVAWAVLFMCLGGAVVVIVGVAILMISSDQ
jgi:predicted permease